MSNYFDFLNYKNICRWVRIFIFLGKWAGKFLAASIEVYLRSNFGRRYVRMLFGALFLCLFCAGLNSKTTILTSLYLFGLWALVIKHFIFVFRRHRLSIPEPHSSYSGDSWKYWQNLGLPQVAVQGFLEPSLCTVVGLIIYTIDRFLGFWILASAISLFVKELLGRVRNTSQLINAMDAKIEAQRQNAAITQFQQKPGQGAQKPQRAHFAHPGQRRNP